MVIAQEPTQSLAALHRPLAVDVGSAREQQDVVLPLMIALSMVQFNNITPTGPKRRRFCIDGIRGLVGGSSFTR